MEGVKLMKIQTELIIKMISGRACLRKAAAVMTATLVITGIAPVTVSASDEMMVIGEETPQEELPGSETGEMMIEELLTEDTDMEGIVPEVIAPEVIVPEDNAPEAIVPEDSGQEKMIPEELIPEEIDTETDGAEGIVTYDTDEQLYTVHYILEYNGKQLCRTTTPVKADTLQTEVKDGVTVYGIDPDKDFFKRSYEALFKGIEKEEQGIVSYNIIMKAVYMDGRRIQDDEGKEVPDKTETVSANAYDGGYRVPLTYNDVYVYAQIGAYATDTIKQNGVVISAATGVRYCGLQHKLRNDPASNGLHSGKRASYDIDLKITDQKREGGYELEYGRDYTVQYKNNINASVRFTGNREEDGYVQIYGSHEAAAKWPQIIIKGRGNYRDLKSTVYFDILPAPVADGCKAVGPFADGVKESYTLGRTGGIGMNVAPVRYATVYDNMTDSYVINRKSLIRYRLTKELIVELQKLNKGENKWERIGDLTDASKRRDTLRAVTEAGDYRIQATGTGNFYGNLYDTFSVFGNGQVLFSSLKLKISDGIYSSEGVKAETMVKGISTAVRTVSGAKVVIPMTEMKVTLIPASESAKINADGTAALSAGKYRVSVGPKNINEFKKDYPLVALDGNAEAAVTVKGAKLDKKMFTVSWNKAGETCDGRPKDVEITLNGIKTQDITLAKKVIKNGREAYIPLTEKELASAYKTSGDERIIIKGSYELEDGRIIDNTLPGKYSVVLYGKNGYADSVCVYRYIRTGALFTNDKLSADAVSYNAGGAMTSVRITMPDGKSVRTISGTGDDGFRVEYRNNKRTGSAIAVVKVRDNTSGYRRGSEAKVVFPVTAREVKQVYPYEKYSSDMPGEVFIKTADTIRAGTKKKCYTLYQASADGKKLVALNNRDHKGSVSANTPAGTSKTYDLKIENGQTGYFDFIDVTVKNVYTEYSAAANKWTAQSALVLSTDAVVIKDAGDRRVYDSTDIGTYGISAISVTNMGKGIYSVPYVGGSYILPKIPELTVNGKTLRLSDGDYVISYKNNNRVGTGRMVVTITQSGAKRYGFGGSKAYMFKIVPQKSTNLNL